MNLPRRICTNILKSNRCASPFLLLLSLCVSTLVQSSGRNRAAVDTTHTSAATESTTLVQRYPEHRYRSHLRSNGSTNSISIGKRSKHDERIERRDDDDHRVVHREREHLDYRDELKPRFLVQRHELLLYLRVTGLLCRLRSLEQSRYDDLVIQNPRFVFILTSRDC